MTRDELLKKICPWGTCDCGDDYESCNCNDCNRVLEEWLYDYEKQVRADAIDDFAKRLKAECRKHYVDCDQYFVGIPDSILYEGDIDEIAEELKADDKNEN